jgi:hypothetical protein
MQMLARNIALVKELPIPSNQEQMLRLIAESLPPSFQGPYRYASLQLAFNYLLPHTPRQWHHASIIAEIEKGTIPSWNHLANFGIRWGLFSLDDWNATDDRMVKARNQLLYNIADSLPETFEGPYTFDVLAPYITRRYGTPIHPTGSITTVPHLARQTPAQFRLFPPPFQWSFVPDEHPSRLNDNPDVDYPYHPVMTDFRSLPPHVRKDLKKEEHSFSPPPRFGSVLGKRSYSPLPATTRPSPFTTDDVYSTRRLRKIPLSADRSRDSRIRKLMRNLTPPQIEALLYRYTIAHPSADYMTKRDTRIAELHQFLEDVLPPTFNDFTFDGLVKFLSAVRY